MQAVDELCEVILRSRLLSSAELGDLKHRWRAEAKPSREDAAKFSGWLVDQEYLTSYQAERLLRGQADRHFINQYKIVDRLGIGRMAGVFKAVHRLGQVVAVKVLPPSKAKDAQIFGRFQREGRLAVRLKHPNVVRTFQLHEDAGLHFLVMEYLDGQTLEEVLNRRGKLTTVEAVRVVHQALLGLQHLHEKGMVHRDMKPGNLMLNPTPEPGEEDTTLEATVKLVDVGLGRALFDEGEDGNEAGGDADLTRKGDMLGTPDYMAPEQARDPHAADIRADIYALGCVLYHCVAGQPPFPGKNVVEKLVKHARETPKPLKTVAPDAPAGLQPVLDRMLAKEPAKRYATPAEAVRALDACLAEKPQTARRKPVAQPLQEYEAWLKSEPGEADGNEGTPRHWKWILGGAAAAVVGLAVTLGIVLSRGGPDNNVPAPPGKGPGADGGKNTETDEAWGLRVAGLSPEDQVREVGARLKLRNPGYDGTTTHTIQDNAVTDLELPGDRITDLSPVKALTGLKRLSCAGSEIGKGKLIDLSPLAALPLAVLDVTFTRVADLGPLRDVPLLYLGIAGTQVRDLTPLQGMQLSALNCSATPITDLGPLAGMKLTFLDAADAPLRDLAPLGNMPLEAIWCPAEPLGDGEILGSMANLKDVNGRPVSEMRQQATAQKKKLIQQVAALTPAKQVDAVIARLVELNPGFDGKVEPKFEKNGVVELRFLADNVTNLSPLQALPSLRRLHVHGSAPGKGKLVSLHTLGNLKLIELDCGACQIADLSPLKDMPLTYLNVSGNTRVSDLGPLAKMSLTQLNVADTQVNNLEPLRKLKLTSLTCYGTEVIDLSAIKEMPLTGLSCDFQPARDLETLRAIPTLKKLNSKSWQETEAKLREFETWVGKVAAMPPAKQAQSVADALKDRNPGFDGKLTPTSEGAAVVQLSLSGDAVADLMPVRALPKLRKLVVAGSAAGKGAMSNLWPLKGLALEELDVSNSKVADLTPLYGLPLKQLNLTGTSVTDLTPLRGLPLVHIKGSFDRGRDEAVFTAIASLATINGTKAADFWARAESGKGSTVTAKSAKPPPQPKTVSRFVGKLIAVQPTDHKLTLQLTQSIVVQNTWHTAWLVHHQLRLQEAPRIKNAADRARFIQGHLFWMVHHQSHLYRRHDQHQRINLQAAAAVNVRVLQLPPLYDEMGALRKPTPQDLKKLKGDTNLPGYTGVFAALRPGQVVEVYMARADDYRLTPQDVERGVAPATGGAVLNVSTIIIVQESL